jgi:hypothetical protein
MNILNAGGWYVGNTAILDWMDGFDELAVVKGDCNIIRLDNGIMDMIAQDEIENKLDMIRIQKKSCLYGIYLSCKHKVGQYTKNILKPKVSPSHNLYIKFYTTYYHYLKNYEKLLSEGDTFSEIEYWKKWLSTLPKLDSNDKNYQSVVYQNPFFYDETYLGHKAVWPKLFSPHKMIFVHRDPLDQFSDIVNSGSHFNSSWPRFHGDTEDIHPADRFFEISKKIYNARLRMAEDYTSDELIIFSFEDFINNHEQLVIKLKVFLNITEYQSSRNDRFSLAKSRKNIANGKNNEKVTELLQGKDYIIEELNELRNRLIKHPSSI